MRPYCRCPFERVFKNPSTSKWCSIRTSIKSKNRHKLKHTNMWSLCDHFDLRPAQAPWHFHQSVLHYCHLWLQSPIVAEISACFMLMGNCKSLTFTAVILPQNKHLCSAGLCLHIVHNLLVFDGRPAAFTVHSVETQLALASSIQ